MRTEAGDKPVVHVVFFASLREVVGVEAMDIQACRLSDVEKALAEQLSPPALEAVSRDNVRIAVNQNLTEGDLCLRQGDEVAFLPPVTGG